MAKRKNFTGVNKRSRGTFRINYTDAEGNRQFETVECETAEEAHGIRLARLNDIAKGIAVSSKPNTITFEELAADVVNDYLAKGNSSWKDIEGRFRLHLNPFFGKKRAAKITTADFTAYIVHRKTEGAKVGTICRELEAARHAFYLGLDSKPPKVLVKPKIPMPKENNVRKGYFELEQLEAICRHLPAHLIPVARFGYITGWRHQEVMTRCWRHVTNAGISLDPGETKNDEGRTFPMVAPLKTLLDSLRPEGAVFPNARIFTRDGKDIVRFDKAWATACRKAGLPIRYVQKRRMIDKDDRSKGKEVVTYKRGPKKGQPILVMRAAVYFHDFRRTAYRNLVWAGIPEKQARLAVGWLDPKTAERYNVPAKSDMDVIRERYDATYGGLRANSRANRTSSGAVKPRKS